MSDVIKDMLARLAQQDADLLRLYPPGFHRWDTLKIGIDPVYEPKNYPVQGFISELSIERTTRYIQDAMAKTFAVDAALLGQVGSDSTAASMTLTYDAVKSSIDAYLDSLRDTTLDMFKTTCWVIKSYVLIYLRGRPAIILCGTGVDDEYVESLPKRFTSSHKARKWARSQLGSLIVDMTIWPTTPLHYISFTVDRRDEVPDRLYGLDWGRQIPIVQRDAAVIKLSSL